VLGQRQLLRNKHSLRLMLLLVAIVAGVSALAGMVTVAGTRIPVLNPVPALCLAIVLVFGLRAWPAVLAGSLAWSAFALAPDGFLIAGYSASVTLAAVAGGWGILRYWRLDLVRNAVHNLVVMYAFGALAVAAVMVGILAPLIALHEGMIARQAALLSAWLLSYVILGITIFLPAMMLMFLRTPRMPGALEAPGPLKRLGVRGWLLATLVIVALHAWLSLSGREYLAISLRYGLLFMLIVAALRFEFRFNAIALVAVVGYLIFTETSLARDATLALELSHMLEMTVAISMGVMASQIISMYRLEGRAALLELRRRREHDELTGLLNRESFLDQLERACAAGDGHFHACLNVDVDRFGVMTDNLGVEGGGLLLREVGEVISGGLPVTAAVARLEGDEFGVLLKALSPANARKVADEVRQRVEVFGFDLQGERRNVTVSVGIVPFRGGDAASDLVLMTANTAKKLAKQGGRNAVRELAVDDHLVDQRRRSSALVEEIREAIRHNCFEIWCQELRPLRGASPDGLSYEILSRATGREGRPLPPVEIFPVAEKYELMKEIDRLVTRNTLAWLADHPDCLRRTDTCCINLSGASLEPANAEHYASLIESFRIPPARLCFEVTETAAVTRFTAAVEFMRRLKAMGCRFALDDFGTGMSSFQYVRELPVDKVKIDGAFVRGLEAGGQNHAIVKAIVSVARAFGLETVAEFADNRRTIELLAELGVDYAQGHGISEAMPIEAFFGLAAPSRGDAATAMP
jgi:diguanylate cyclase (GGDEF)-like protein